MSIQEFLGQELLDSLRKCPVEDHAYLISPVLEIEILDVVKEMKAESSPGAIGFSNLLLKEMVPFMSKVLADFGDRLFFDDASLSCLFLPQAGSLYFESWQSNYWRRLLQRA